MDNQTRIIIFMLAAIASSSATMMACANLLRGKLGVYPELALSVGAAVAVYVLVSRALMGRPR